MIQGQTNIEPCAICGEPSTEQRVMEPGENPKEVKSVRIHKVTRHRWLCAEHIAAVERDMEWQERQAKQRSVHRRKFKKLQEISTLFDGDDGAPAGTGRAG